MIKIVIFDADGLITNQERFSIALERDYGISVEKTLPFFNGVFQECLVGNADLKETISPYLADWGWTKGLDAFIEYWFEREHKINSELVEYIQGLRHKGILCFLATNNERYRFEYMLNKMGFKNSFDKTYSSAHLGHKKPNQEFFLKIFTDLKNIKKKEILFWDDRARHIQGAKDFGIHTELYTSFEDFKEKMKQYIDN